MKYYEVLIRKTAKPIGGKGGEWEEFDHENLDFATIERVKEYLQEQYSQVKTTYKVYVDLTNGDSLETGKIYAFKNQDISHMTPAYYQQDWVTIREVEKESHPILI